MKKKGSKSDFTRQRDRELYAHFMDILSESRGVTLGEMFAMAARRPASRFWVSETRAAIVIGAMMRGEDTALLDNMYAERRAMYEELFRRVCARMEADPGLCMTRAVDEVVCEPAPRFYITDKSAKVIIYRIRRRIRLERNLKALRTR
jgi:hypothetical protein